MPKKPAPKGKRSRAARVGKAILAEIAEHKKRLEVLEAKKAAKPAPRKTSIFEELFGTDEEE